MPNVCSTWIKKEALAVTLETLLLLARLDMTEWHKQVTDLIIQKKTLSLEIQIIKKHLLHVNKAYNH